MIKKGMGIQVNRLSGIGLTALVLAILTGVKYLEQMILGPCTVGAVDLAFTPDGGRAEMGLRAILDRYGIDDTAYRFTDLKGKERSLSLRYCHVHRHHRGITAELSAHPSVLRVGTQAAA